MAKIGFFILPPYKFKKRINRIKAKIYNEYGDQFYLNHLPHMTLFTLNIDNINLLTKKVSNYNFGNNKFKNIKIHTKKIEYFLNDPFTSGNTQYISIYKNKKLLNLQLYLINKFKNLKSKKRKEKFKSNNLKLLNNFEKYGFPYIGKIWIPHLTICSFKKKYKIDDIEIKNNVKEVFEVKKISIFKIVRNNHIHLIDIKL